MLFDLAVFYLTAGWDFLYVSTASAMQFSADISRYVFWANDSLQVCSMLLMTWSGMPVSAETVERVMKLLAITANEIFNLIVILLRTISYYNIKMLFLIAVRIG